MITLRPLGPRVTATAFARISTPLSNDARPSTPNLSSLCPAYPRRATIALMRVERGIDRVVMARYILNKGDRRMGSEEDVCSIEFSRRSAEKIFGGDDRIM
jgi:hypothetical protein